MTDSNRCPVCGMPKETGTDFCNQCGWEYRHYFIPLTGDFLELEQRRLSKARQHWQTRTQPSGGNTPNEGYQTKQAEERSTSPGTYSYGILVSYRGEECVSNMIFRNDPAEVVREWPAGKFKTQTDNQSSITLPIYCNQSDERIVPIAQCRKVINATIALDINAPKGTPINIRWERDKDHIIQVKVSCMNKETIVRL